MSINFAEECRRANHYTKPQPLNCFYRAHACSLSYLLTVSDYQWRRQTIKSGSAFKGKLYFQVGQMERWSAPTLGVMSEEEHRSPSPLRGLGYAPSKFFKNQPWNHVFSAFCKLKALICSVGKAHNRTIIARPTYMGLDRYSKSYAIKPVLANGNTILLI